MMWTRLAAVVVTLLVVALASPNGNYYGCDFRQNGDGKYVCHFETVEYDGTTWIAKEHTIDKDTPVAERVVKDAGGATLPVSPKPWANGDYMGTGTPEGYAINYARVFEVIGPLRNRLMYHPEDVTKEEFDKLTKSMVDCDVKATTTSATPFDLYSVADIWDAMHWDSDPTGAMGPSKHHFILQFLEEGAIDFVCLVTDLDMEGHDGADGRCDVIRAHHGINRGDVMTCWLDGYEAVTGEPAYYYDGTKTLTAPSSSASGDSSTETPSGDSSTTTGGDSSTETPSGDSSTTTGDSSTTPPTDDSSTASDTPSNPDDSAPTDDDIHSGGDQPSGDKKKGSAARNNVSVVLLVLSLVMALLY